jgi:STE24 endopeptidase
LKELPEGELRDKILALCEKQNYKLKRIYVMDSSKRSSKSNAFFSGIGKTKTIVLFDSLISKHTVDEVVGVLGHEMGHDKLGHIRSMLLLNMFQSFIIFALFGWALQEPALSEALGGNGIQLVLSLIAFGMLFSPINFLLAIFDNSMTRRNEHGADIFASKVYGKEHIISALQRLSSDNLANPAPHPLYVLAYYSHPPASKRVSHVQEAKLA